MAYSVTWKVFGDTDSFDVDDNLEALRQYLHKQHQWRLTADGIVAQNRRPQASADVAEILFVLERLPAVFQLTKGSTKNTIVEAHMALAALHAWALKHDGQCVDVSLGAFIAACMLCGIPFHRRRVDKATGGCVFSMRVRDQ